MMQPSTATLHEFGIVGYFNDRKHGKTTGMVQDIVRKVHAGEYDQASFNIHVGPKVDSKGFHFGDPKIHFINFEQLMKLELPTKNGEARAIVGLDQIANYVDARTPHAKKNRLFTKWARESRQHGCDMEYTSWMRSEVDKRVRPFTDLVINCYRRPFGLCCNTRIYCPRLRS